MFFATKKDDVKKKKSISKSITMLMFNNMNRDKQRLINADRLQTQVCRIFKDSLTVGLVRLQELKVLITLADWSSQHSMTSFS